MMRVCESHASKEVDWRTSYDRRSLLEKILSSPDLYGCPIKFINWVEVNFLTRSNKEKPFSKTKGVFSIKFKPLEIFFCAIVIKNLLEKNVKNTGKKFIKVSWGSKKI